MVIFKKILIFVIFCIIFQGSYGRKWYTYEPYWGSSHSPDKSKFVDQKVLNMDPEKNKNDESLQNAHLFKTNADVSKKFLQKLPQNENHPSKSNSANFETLETQVGKHLVKVTSKKESQSLSYAPSGGGYDISINPKYSHIVEIIHRRNNVQKQNKPAVEMKISNSEKVTGTKFNENPNKFGETEANSEKLEVSEENIEESGKTEGESEKFEAGKENTEESGNTRGEFSKTEVESEEFEAEEDTDDSGKNEEFEVDESGKTEGEFEEFDEFDTDEKDTNESGKTEGEFEEFDADEEDTDESGKTEGEFEEFDEYDADEEDTDESGKTEGKFEEFESDEEDREESDKTEGESEADEEDNDEFDETERKNEGFFESDEDYPEEYDETEDANEFEDPELFHETENDPDEFETDYERDSDESDETEGDAEEFGQANENDLEESEETEDLEKAEGDAEFVDTNEKNAGKTDKADVRGPEVFEVPEEIILESNKTERDPEKILPGDIEEAKNKKNGISNEKMSHNKESSFNEESEGSGEEFTDTNDRNTTKTGRILGMLSRRNETFPTCTTQRGEAGHCRRLGECLLSEALSNFNGFLQQLCLIRGALVGICCPDNPVIETVNPDDNTTNELSAEEIEQPPEGCGLNTKTRIVGGSISVPHEWTWMVALMRRNRFYCGGVIINNWYILTAAHCVMGMNVKDLTVRLGEYDFNEQGKHTEDLSVSEIKRHAQFVTLTFQHDIALLKLKRSIKYSKFVGSICLPEQKARDYSDVKGTVVGWGTVSFGGAASPVLRQVTVPVWKNEDCDRTYLLENIGDSFMCAGAPDRGEDACQGDSGGPLMTVNESGRWEVIGLVSWGRRCGDPTYPGVYTRVTTYLDWIKQNAV